MKNYEVKFTRDETLSIIAGLQKELKFQNAQSAMYQGDSTLAHFSAYHSKLAKRADSLIDKLLAMPGLAEANNQALLGRVGREPEFIVALALKYLNDEKYPEANAAQVQSCPVANTTSNDE